MNLTRSPTAIRWPVVEPDRDVRGFQTVLLDLGARLGLPGMVDENGEALFRDYADYLAQHERKPGIGPLAGFRGTDGNEDGRGEANPDQLERYIANGGFWMKHIPQELAFFRMANRGYQDWAVSMGFYDAPEPYVFNLYLEPLRKFQLAAEGHAEVQPPEHLRQRVKECFTPLPDWYPPFEGEGIESNEYPYYAITQRPAAMYHSWGSQNAWLRQIHGENPLYVPGPVCDRAGLVDGDWARVSSYHGSISVPVKRMDAVNEKTLWTWNAIGKRAGAWNLSPNAPEARRGFLLNHLINELLPPKGDGQRYANSDPITGQAAWYDLRVNIEKLAEPPRRSQPEFEQQANPLGRAPDDVEYGGEW